MLSRAGSAARAPVARPKACRTTQMHAGLVCGQAGAPGGKPRSHADARCCSARGHGERWLLDACWTRRSPPMPVPCCWPAQTLPAPPRPALSLPQVSKVVAIKAAAESLTMTGRLRVTLRPLLNRLPLLGAGALRWDWVWNTALYRRACLPTPLPNLLPGLAAQVAFTEMPRFSFGLSLLGGDVSVLPGLEAWLHSLFSDAVLRPMVLPEKRVAWPGGRGGACSRCTAVSGVPAAPHWRSTWLPWLPGSACSACAPPSSHTGWSSRWPATLSRTWSGRGRCCRCRLWRRRTCRAWTC